MKKRIINLKRVIREIRLLVGAAVEIEMACGGQGTTPPPGAVWEAIFGSLPPYSRIIKVETVMSSGKGRQERLPPGRAAARSTRIPAASHRGDRRDVQ